MLLKKRQVRSRCRFQFFLSFYIEGYSNEVIRTLIQDGCIRANKKTLFTDLYVKPGTQISAYLLPKTYECNYKPSTMSNFEYKPHFMEWDVIKDLQEDYAVINKPPSLCTIPTKDTRMSLVPYWLKKYLSRNLNANLLVTSRLDAGTHGLIVVGRNKRYVKDYNKVIEKGTIVKKYRAVVDGWDPKLHKTGLWVHYFHERKGVAEENSYVVGDTQYSYIPDTLDHLKVKATKDRNDTQCVQVKMIVASAKLLDDSTALKPFDPEWMEDVKKTSTLYELEIELLTGKTHQIRAQLECENVVIVGDKLYGSKYVLKGDTFALCCHTLKWKCPTKKQEKQYILDQAKIEGNHKTKTFQ